MCLISALLHAHLVRFEIVLQIASAAAPGELGAVLGGLIEVVPIVDILARAWIFRSEAFLIHYLLGRFGNCRDGRCRVRWCENTEDGNGGDGNNCSMT